MLAPPEFLVARTIPGLVPIHDARCVIRVLIASLARGGAERIVLDWLAGEAKHGRGIELAVLHPRTSCWGAPEGVVLRVRGAGESPTAFLNALARDWRGAPEPVSVHLIADAQLTILWEAGLATVPVVHNARAGWRNDPGSWDPARVPLAIACADAVREEMLAEGCAVPVVTIRHRPRVGREAFDPAQRTAVREALGISPATLLVGAVGAIKPQKDYPRAVEVLACLARRREAVLAIVGGVLDGEGLRELDRIAATAARLGVGTRLRLPGFADPVEPLYAAFDAVLNVSRFEGLSIAAQEALAAGLPVVATDVGGQGEIAGDRLTLVAREATVEEISQRLAAFPIRRELEPSPGVRAPRIWTLSLSPRPAPESTPARIETLFVTANLNAGGAQRSLVNLCTELAGRHAFAIAVCGDSTHPSFPERLARAGIETFRPAAAPDPFATSEELLATAAARGAKRLCFWNADAKVKLLVAKFAPRALRLLDVSPGRYAFEELESARDFAQAITYGTQAYYRRLDALVLKHRDPSPPACARIEYIANGVASSGLERAWPRRPRFLLSGRIAPSKRIEIVLEAFAIHRNAHPESGLDIVGQAEERHADYLAQLLAAAASLPVRFRGALPDLAFLAEPYTAAVVLGTHQGCPNAVLEAMSAGLPVIANASGGTAELVGHRETGWLLPEDCGAGALAEAMDEAAADASRARRFGENGWRRASAGHALAAMARRYLALFDGAGAYP